MNGDDLTLAELDWEDYQRAHEAADEAYLWKEEPCTSTTPASSPTL